MIKRPSKRSVLITSLLLFVAIQIKTTDKTPIKVTPETDFLTLEDAPQEVTQLIQSTCYDCHSNHTQYPWYSHVAPISWWLEGHINNGKSKVNFSIWDSYTPAQQASLKNESAELIEKKWMPILTYKITHADARLTEAQRHMLIDWLKE